MLLAALTATITAAPNPAPNPAVGYLIDALGKFRPHIHTTSSSAAPITTPVSTYSIPSAAPQATPAVKTDITNITNVHYYGDQTRE